MVMENLLRCGGILVGAIDGGRGRGGQDRPRWVANSGRGLDLIWSASLGLGVDRLSNHQHSQCNHDRCRDTDTLRDKRAVG